MVDNNNVIGALKFATDNFDSPDPESQKIAGQTAAKLNVPIMELKKLRYAQANPDDPNSLKIKNDVFDYISKTQPAMTIKSGGGLLPTERIGIKNLINENISLQKTYLERRGYETRENNGELEVRKKGDPYFQPIDPAGFDYLDIADVTGDIIKGVVEGVGTGAKVFGMLGAPFTGGSSIPVTSALSGGLSAATETARQGLGVALGLRPEMDPNLIGKEALWGATIGGTLKTAGVGLDKYGKNLAEASAMRLAQRPEAQKIKEAWEYLGGKATEGMLRAEETVRSMEDAVMRAGNLLLPGVRNLKNNFDQNVKALADNALIALNNASKRTFGTDIKGVGEVVSSAKDVANDYAFQILKKLGATGSSEGKFIPQFGRDVKQAIIDKITSKTAEASKIYTNLENELSKRVFNPNINPIIETINKLKPKMDDTSLAWLNKVEEYAGRIKNFNDLKEFGTLIGNEFRRGDDVVKRYAKQINKSIYDAKEQSFMDAILGAINKFENNKNQYPQELFQKNVDKFVGLRNDLLKANKLWREANEELIGVIKRPGETMFQNATGKLDKLVKTKPEQVFKSVLSPDDVDKAEWMIKTFPKEYSQVLSAKMNDILLRSVEQNKPLSEYVLNELKKLPNSQRQLLFGNDYYKHFNNLNYLIKNADNKELVAEKLTKIVNASENVQARNKDFGTKFAQEIKRLPDDDLKLLFGADEIPRLEAIKIAEKYAIDLFNPSKTKLRVSWEDFIRYMKYRSWISPTNYGQKIETLGKNLGNNKSFGMIEGIRSSILPSSLNDQNNQ